MREVLKATWREIHIPAEELISFMQTIYATRREGNLNIYFGAGGVPSGTMIWKERVTEASPSTPPVDSTRRNGDLVHHPA